jgi:hypothetical protein
MGMRYVPELIASLNTDEAVCTNIVLEVAKQILIASARLFQDNLVAVIVDENSPGDREGYFGVLV